jgi:hypothetical protein
MEEKRSNVAAIREYFSKDSRKVEMQELKDLSQEEREELGALCKKELGWE